MNDTLLRSEEQISYRDLLRGKDIQYRDSEGILQKGDPLAYTSVLRQAIRYSEPIYNVHSTYELGNRSSEEMLMLEADVAITKSPAIKTEHNSISIVIDFKQSYDPCVYMYGEVCKENHDAGTIGTGNIFKG